MGWRREGEPFLLSCRLQLAERAKHWGHINKRNGRQQTNTHFFLTVCVLCHSGTQPKYKYANYHQNLATTGHLFLALHMSM